MLAQRSLRICARERSSVPLRSIPTGTQDSSLTSGNESIFLGSLDERLLSRNVRRWTIRRAKLNWKYRRGAWQKKQRRRVNEQDINVLAHFVKGLEITVGYDPKNNDLWFERDVDGEDVEMDGWDTGGQLIRLFLTLAIVSGRGRTEEPEPLELPIFRPSEGEREKGKKGKAIMLYVQAAMWSLSVGQSFTVKGGDPLNSDAPSSEDYRHLFDLFRYLFGRNLRMTVDGHSYTVSREKDCGIQTNFLDESPSLSGEGWQLTEVGDGKILSVNIHLVDQIIMGAVVLRAQCVPFGKITIKTAICQDYHPEAMIKAGRALGMNIIDDSKPEAPKDEKGRLATGGERIITIH